MLLQTINVSYNRINLKYNINTKTLKQLSNNNQLNVPVHSSVSEIGKILHHSNKRRDRLSGHQTLTEADPVGEQPPAYSNRATTNTSGF